MNLNYFIAEEEFAFIVSAVDMVATHAWKLLPFYQFDVEKGSFKHRDALKHELMSLHGISYLNGKMTHPSTHTRNAFRPFKRYLDEALRVFDRAPALVVARASTMFFPAYSEMQRSAFWFLVPEQAFQRVLADARAATGDDGGGGKAIQVSVTPHLKNFSADAGMLARNDGARTITEVSEVLQDAARSQGQDVEAMLTAVCDGDDDDANLTSAMDFNTSDGRCVTLQQLRTLFRQLGVEDVYAYLTVLAHAITTPDMLRARASGQLTLAWRPLIAALRSAE